jgi:hypothetical protein
MTIPLKKVAKRWIMERGLKEGYDALEDEFALASQQTEARSRAGLTQAEVGDRMGTSHRPLLGWRADARIPLDNNATEGRPPC